MSIVDILRSKNLSEYISDLELQPDGTWRSTCKIHNGTNPTSFAVFPNNTCYCFSCGFHSDIIGYVMERDNSTFDQAIETLCDDYCIDLKKDQGYQQQKSLADRNEQLVRQYEKNLEKCYQYLTEKRGLSDDIIRKYNIGWSEKGKCIVIPMRNIYSQTVGFLYRFFETLPKYKNSKGNELFEKGKFLFNVNNAQKLIKKKKRLWVCEGAFDAISCQQQEEAAVAYCGITFTKDHVLLIKELTERIEGCQVVICPDADGKAEKWVSRGRQLFSQHYPNAVVKVAVIT